MGTRGTPIDLDAFDDPYEVVLFGKTVTVPPISGNTARLHAAAEKEFNETHDLGVLSRFVCAALDGQITDEQAMKLNSRQLGAITSMMADDVRKVESLRAEIAAKNGSGPEVAAGASSPTPPA